MTPFDAAKLCQAIYAPTSSDFDKVINVGCVTAGLKYTATSTIVAFRGSCDFEDWLNDLSIIPEHDPELGCIVKGFLDDMREFAIQVQPMIVGQLEITGHSLGAARACILAGLMQFEWLIIVGCPQLCTEKLKVLIFKNGKNVLSFKNHGDLVTDVPPFYDHVLEPTQIMSDPTPCTDIQAHEIDRYVEALSN